MATDIFNRSTVNYGGSFAADGARVTFAGGGALQGNANPGLLVQRMTFAYQQQVTRLYELSSNTIYYVGGRTAGDASMDRVLGPKALSQAFYAAYGDICNAASNTLQASLNAQCGNTAATLAANPAPRRRSRPASAC